MPFVLQSLIKNFCVDLTQSYSSVMVRSRQSPGCADASENKSRPKSTDEKNGVAREIAPPLSLVDIRDLNAGQRDRACAFAAQISVR